MTGIENNDNLRPWLTPKEVAALTAQSEPTIRRQCYSGILPSRKFGRALRIPREAVEPRRSGEA